jgi:putative spermidine/putrescine transport system ATP-binding protein
MSFITKDTAMSPSPSETPLVRFSGVRKTYDGKSFAVRNLDLEVRRGEFLTLLGPSGSGKTTVLMMLAGFESPSAGEIHLDGRRISDLPPNKRDLGIVFQNYALFPHMTVAENIAFPLSVRGMGRAEIAERVTRALDMVQLAGLGERKPAQLSGGQQQRVAVARALVFEPRLVLMDEPLGALDKQLREQMQLEIKHLQRRLGVTLVYVTHDQSEALTMSDRIAVFNAGDINQLAAPFELYEQPASLFVAEFIGENNRLEGEVVARGGEVCDVRLAGGAVVRALAVGVLAPGQRAALSIRPERLAFAAGQNTGNQLSLRVSERVYHGDHLRLCLGMPGGADIVMKVPNHPGGSLPAIGEPVEIGWRTEDCRAFALEQPV